MLVLKQPMKHMINCMVAVNTKEPQQVMKWNAAKRVSAQWPVMMVRIAAKKTVRKWNVARPDMMAKTAVRKKKEKWIAAKMVSAVCQVMTEKIVVKNLNFRLKNNLHP